jgi:hypothetical protein
MVIECCGCKRVREEGEWKRPAVVPADSISHTYCPACLATAQAQMVPSAKGYRVPPIGPVPVFSNFAYKPE